MKEFIEASKTCAYDLKKVYNASNCKINLATLDKAGVVRRCFRRNGTGL
jgi:hypothetical protein